MKKADLAVRRREYEVTYLVPAALTKEELTQVNEAVAKLIKKYDGQVTKSEDWGRKNLAYTIKLGGKRYNEGIYTHLLVDLPTASTQGFERELRLASHVIRELVVLSEPEAPVAAVASPAVTDATDEVSQS